MRIGAPRTSLLRSTMSSKASGLIGSRRFKTHAKQFQRVFIRRERRLAAYYPGVKKETFYGCDIPGHRHQLARPGG